MGSVLPARAGRWTAAKTRSRKNVSKCEYSDAMPRSQSASALSGPG